MKHLKKILIFINFLSIFHFYARSFSDNMPLLLQHWVKALHILLFKIRVQKHLHASWNCIVIPLNTIENNSTESILYPFIFPSWFLLIFLYLISLAFHMKFLTSDLYWMPCFKCEKKKSYHNEKEACQIKEQTDRAGLMFGSSFCCELPSA